MEVSLQRKRFGKNMEVRRRVEVEFGKKRGRRSRKESGSGGRKTREVVVDIGKNGREFGRKWKWIPKGSGDVQNVEMHVGKQAGVDFAKNAGRTGHGSLEDEWESRGLARYVQRRL